MGHSFLYARQNTGLLWHTAVRPSVHASYDNISHLFPLLLIGQVVTSPRFLCRSTATARLSMPLNDRGISDYVVTYIVLIKGGASERCDFNQFGKRHFSYCIYN